jgi:nucleoside-diphosphate-sugar epimerase
MAKAIVTGGAGFIGSHIADALVQKGFDVTIVDNLATGRAGNIAHLLDSVEFIEKSILDDAALAQAFAGAEVVFHQAAIPSVPRSIEEPLLTHEVNATGTLKVLLAARKAGVKRVVYASSSSYYGDAKELPKREDMPPNPLSPYALQKFAGERYLTMAHALFGIETVCLRYFNVFGPRQNPDSEYAAVIPKFIKIITSGAAPIIFGDGSTTRDFTYVSDVVQANLCAASAPNVAGEVFNIAGGRQISLNELVALIGKTVGVAVTPTYQPFRPGDILHSLADISKAERMLGFVPQIKLEEGLMRTAAALNAS